MDGILDMLWKQVSNIIVRATVRAQVDCLLVLKVHVVLRRSAQTTVHVNGNRSR